MSCIFVLSYGMHMSSIAVQTWPILKFVRKKMYNREISEGQTAQKMSLMLTEQNSFIKSVFSGEVDYFCCICGAANSEH